MNRSTRIGFEVSFFALVLTTVLPLLRFSHPPLQDLPQHLATIRALTDFGDASLHFRDYYVVELGRTQYLAYYLVTAFLAKALGVALANKLVMTAAVGGAPYAMRFLLRALGRDERAAVFVLPLTWNAHLILGFVNFVAAIPLTLVALALAIRLRESFSPRLATGLAVLLVVTFYTHVVPFGFAAFGATLILAGESLRATAMRYLALVPAGLATLLWAVRSPAGQATLTAARGHDTAGPQPIYATVAESLNQIPMWLTDVLVVDTDEKLFAAFGVVLLLALGIGADAVGTELTQRARTVVGLLAPLAGLAYFVTPDSYDWIWPIHARFPLLALIFLVATIRLPDRLVSFVPLTLAAAITLLSAQAITTAFAAFEHDEVGELDRAIAAIPRGERVVGLIWDRGSSHVKFSPFLHSVAYYQAARGGAVMFSFADFPQSPLRFREDRRPPRVWPRWEWTPERVDTDAQLAWYHYALVRGGPGPIGMAGGTWQRVGDYGPWHVFRRVAR